MIHTDGTPTIAHRTVDRALAAIPDVLVTKEDPWHFTVQAVSREAKERLDSEPFTVDLYDFKRLHDELVDAGLVVR